MASERLWKRIRRKRNDNARYSRMLYLVFLREVDKMKEVLRVVYEGGEGEIIEKKSRFIATVRPVDTEEEALEFIEGLKKKYWNATHNCYAYVIGDHMEIQRFSDDGEPSGTAGKPMLEVLLGEEVHNTAVVVTRYFGGTLLGTGGLVRAYGKSVKEGLDNSVVVNKIRGIQLEIRTDYNGLGKIQYLLGQRKIAILNSEYAEDVVVTALVAMTELDELKKAVTEATGGKGIMTEKEELCFAVHEKELLVF